MRLDLYAYLILLLKHFTIQFFNAAKYQRWIIINALHWPLCAYLIKFHSMFQDAIPITCTAINKNNKYQYLPRANLLYVFLFLKWNIKIHFVVTHQNILHCFNLGNLFNGLSWSIREASEMFNLHFINKIDARRLLLEYTAEYSPMLKTFTCEGYEELEYDIRERWLIYQPLKLRDEIYS